MPSFLNSTTAPILASYLILSAAPFAPYLFGKPVSRPLAILGAEVSAWLCIWALLRRPRFFHWLLLPAFLALPTNIYLNMYYGQGITPHHLGIIAETNPREMVEFLGMKIWLLIAVMIAMIAWWWQIWRLTKRTAELDWNHRQSRWVLLVIFAAGVSIASYGHAFGIDSPPQESASTASLPPQASETGDETDEEADEAPDAGSASDPDKADWPRLPAWLALPVDRDTFADTWPFGLALHFYDFWSERQTLAELNEKNKSFSFGASQLPEHDVPQIVVLVIGESSRYDRWEINGYHRNTNPFLKQEANLVSLKDMITPVSATRLSVPVIITRKTARQSLTAGFPEKSLLTAFKEAGFKTYWLSNQISFGQFDTPISAFAKEADVIQFMNLGGYTDKSNFDEILLEPLQNALKDPRPKKLIVLHTLGSHWNYSHRHPQAFDKWKPSLFGIDKPEYTDTAIKPQMHNSYDNSILYADWFLAQVIAQLKNSGVLSSMMFVADHGQVLYDGDCDLAFHGHNTQYEFHIPALVWYSDAYKSANPGKVAQLHRHRKSKLSTENVFHSLLDMANIQYPDEKLERSLFSSKFKRHRRYVDSHGWSNYDNAVFKGDCREVIDKGRPLPQK